MVTCGNVRSDQVVAALLTVWSKDSIRQLLEAVWNTIPYKAIAKELSRQGLLTTMNSVGRK